ncbi:glycerophosphodiester phosphodiesterase family protein [Hyphomonas sp.]|uniref:glycerophosphodiester phosphodiesterase family protein n=1 Tax=Hyphomonas sp. TaxID=87 RepID=UPI0023574E31|nr:glycerophosphodiester phosphodiesterase family protein [Hyphomonas sp.]
MKRYAFSVLSLALITGCGAAPTAEMETGSDAANISQAALPLPEYFDCLRENKGMVIAAHRGGPDTGFPENAIETFQHGFDKGIRVFEIDIAETRDGVLTLMHDDRLNRTTTGHGYVSDTDWETMSGLELEDNDGRRTGFPPPKLTDALLWAKRTGAVLELDKKPTTSFRNIAATVKAANAAENVIFISYNDDQAAEIAAIDPDLMMTASAYGDRDVAKLEARGVDRTRLIGWTGVDEPKPYAWQRLMKVGVEPAFGTLGRKGKRLDDVYLADGDGSEYDALAADGLVLLATDEPYRVADLIRADDVGRAACGR